MLCVKAGRHDLTRDLAVAVIATLIGLMLSGCSFDTKTFTCEASGLRCALGQVCTTEGLCVYEGNCGDGVATPNKECDDNNLIDGDGCDSNCKLTACGNGIISSMSGEECDDGNLLDDDGCDTNCTRTRCGNGVKTGIEECDLGPSNSNNGACLLSCRNAACADTFVLSGIEDCDDGNRVTEACVYGEQSCPVCDMDCHAISGATSACGDGTVQSSNEVCDDGNALSCGTCSMDCKAVRLAFAEGFIKVIAGNLITDDHVSMTPHQDTFILDDGFSEAKVFEFDNNSTSTPGNIRIAFSSNDNAAKILGKVIDAINNSTLLIKASASSSFETTAILKHKLPTGIGNKHVIDNVRDAGFTVMGMTGGGGSDCMSGVGCKTDADCQSNNCEGNTPTTSGTCE